MADPIIPNGIRAQLILQGNSGLPEDRFVTTWAFLRGTGLDYQTAAPGVAQVLHAFMTSTQTNGSKLDSFLSPAVDKTAGKLVIKTYDLGEDPPREPITFLEDFASPSSANGLPAEVAVCGSFVSFRNLKRNRGRIYFGPLSTGALTSEAPLYRVRPSNTIITTLAQALEQLQIASFTQGLTWCVLSQADAELKPITEGWVDDAFDTQRRRGEDAVGRTTWSVPQP